MLRKLAQESSLSIFFRAFGQYLTGKDQQQLHVDFDEIIFFFDEIIFLSYFHTNLQGTKTT